MTDEQREQSSPKALIALLSAATVLMVLGWILLPKQVAISVKENARTVPKAAAILLPYAATVYFDGRCLRNRGQSTSLLVAILSFVFGAFLLLINL